LFADSSTIIKSQGTDATNGEVLPPKIAPAARHVFFTRPFNLTGQLASSLPLH